MLKPLNSTECTPKTNFPHYLLISSSPYLTSNTKRMGHLTQWWTNALVNTDKYQQNND